MKTTAIAPRKPISALPDSVKAQALSNQYARASAAVMEIVAFGCLLLEVQEGLPDGFDVRGGGLRGWLGEHCPEINYNTAASYLRLASGICSALEIDVVASDAGYILSSAADPERLEDDAIALRAAVADAIAGRSKRQLEVEFGLRRPAGPRGGARPGAGRPKASLVDEQLRIDTFFADEVLADWSTAVLARRWHLRLDERRRSILLAVAERIAEDLK